MIQIRDSLVAAAIGGSLIAGAAGPSLAQDAAPGAGMLEEIVVTARKREESIQDAPLSIQAFNAEQLEERGVQNVADIAKYTPGLTFYSGTSRATGSFSIRGMTQINPVGDNRRDLVTTFIDGVPYLGTPVGIGSEDIARVEVIKGPQSALFGRATFGGAISLVTTTPGDQMKGRLDATLGQYGDQRLSGAIEGPIVEGKLSARLLLDASNFDGYYPNTFGGRLGASDRRYGALTLSFTPTDNLSFKLRYGRRADEDGPAASTLIARYTDYNCGPFPGGAPRTSLAGLPAGVTAARATSSYCGELRAPSGPIGINLTLPAASANRLPFDRHHLELDHELTSGTAEWSFLDGHTLTAVASTQDQNTVQLADFERTSDDRYQAFFDTKQSQDTYELRVSSPAEQRLQWMVGVSRLEARYDTAGGFIFGPLFGAAAGGPPLPLVPQISDSKTDSVFGSVGFNLTDTLNLSVEARRQKDTIISGVGTSAPFSIDTRATLPRVLLRWAVSNETNLYANYAKGNQPTQGYATFFQLTPAQQTVARANGVNPSAPEAEVTNYEFGVKHRSEDGRWYLNASLYYLEWVGRQSLRGLQIDLNGDGQITLLPAPAGEVFNVVPFSAGDSNTTGIELDGAFALNDAVTVGFSASHAATDITKALNESTAVRLLGLTDAKGKQYPLVPKLSAAAWAQYERPMAGERTGFVRLDSTYIGKRFDNITNLAWIPPQVRANLRVGLRTDKWDVTAFVDNLFDDDTLESSGSQGDSAADPFLFQLTSSEAMLANKRHFGVTAAFRF